ncbi:Predicted ATPase, AAA+ ATPase superfamily [Epsilonproteobacteria bacterium SCGC AD-308-P11]|jgi:uncharacterized protein|nr:Predicted ATPase, AAA+ ATPase superfamily [Epsilonproteobacteria bacterium SCGC AD-308-P11]
MLFKYGKAVTGDLFYDRTSMQKKVKQYIKAEQSFMLKGPRRYGKTSLIKHVFKDSNKQYFYTDFRKTPRLEVYNDKLIDYIYSLTGIKAALLNLRDNVMGFLRDNKTTIGINLELFEASIELFTKEKIPEEERLINALEMLEKFANDLNITVYIIMDEFQDVLRFNTNKEIKILEILRGAMQHHDNVCYSFLGSHMTLMTEIFENKTSPFYNFCRKLVLDSFDIDEIIPELENAFKKVNAFFDNLDDLKKVLIKLKGHPANTIMVMQNLELQLDTMDIELFRKDNIDAAYNEAFEECNDLISEYIKEINQKEHLHDVIYRMANNEPQELDSKSIYQKYSYLVDMGYIRKISPGKYEIIDGFLAEALK